MAGPLDTYNADIMRQVCETCDAQAGQRCRSLRGKGAMISRPIPAHKMRIAAAGYIWDTETKTLVKLTDLAARQNTPLGGPVPPEGVSRVEDGDGRTWVMVNRLGLWYPEGRLQDGEGVTWAILVTEFGPIKRKVGL